MAYRDIDILPSKESRAVLREVKKFASATMRPAGMELDKTPGPADVLQPQSPLWEVHRAFRKLDLHLVGMPEDVGGMGAMDWMTSLLVAEALGYADAGLAMGLLAASAPFQLAAQHKTPELEKLAKAFCADKECRMMGCLEFAHSGGPTVTASLNRGKYVLNGGLEKVSNAPLATHAAFEVTVVSKGQPDETGLAIIPLDLSGVKKGAPAPKPGQRSLPQGPLAFSDARVPKDCVAVQSQALMQNVKDAFRARTNQTLGVVFAGLAQAAFDEALQYSKGRIQGGGPIFNHKNIKLQLFNMFKMIEAARANARRLAHHQGQYPGTLSPCHAIAAKCLSTETASRVASEAIQVLGGYGLTKEFPIEKLFRDARVAMIEHGVNEDLALVATECF